MSSTIDKPADAPEHCPGPTSENAGKGDACSGCPNKTVCSSGASRINNEDVLNAISERLKNVKNRIIILSGKGGVGKSTVTALLARTLAASKPDINVAVLDIDICGPSQPRILGVLGESVHQSGSGWSPVYVEENLSVMSIGFLLNSADDAIIWRGPKKSGMIRQFLSDVDWGNLDYLFIDSPPGTSDEHLSIANFLSSAGLTGAIIITTPQEVALLDVRKEIDFCRKVGIKVIGVIENMSGFVCPNCKYESEIFPALTGGARQMCSDLNINLLGNLTLDPTLARTTDMGQNYFDEADKESLISKNITSIVEKIENYCKIASQ